MDILSDSAERFLAATAPEHTATQVEMAALADDWGFPSVGRRRAQSSGCSPV